MANTFPVQLNTIVPTGKSGGVRAHMNMDTGQQDIGRAVANVGGELEGMALKIQHQNNAMDISTLNLARDQHDDAAAQLLEKEVDPAKQQEIIDNNEKAKSTLAASYNNDVQAQYQINLNNSKMERRDILQRIGLATQKKDGRMKYGAGMNNAILHNDIEGVKSYAGNALASGIIDQDKFEYDVAKASRQITMNVTLNSALAAPDMESGRAIIAQADIDEKDKNTLDSRVTAKFKRDNVKNHTARYDAQIKSYTEIVPKMIDGSVTDEDIEAMPFGQKSKDKIFAMINGEYYDTAPTETTPQGHKKMTDLVLDACQKPTDKVVAIGKLLDERYTNGSITDADFQDAVQKVINPPYSKHEAGTLDAIMKANETVGAKWFSGVSEKEAATTNDKILHSANTSLIDWYDKQKHNGKEPDAKEVYKKSQEFLSGAMTAAEPKQAKYEVGQTIQKGGKSWKVTGFTPEGKTIVDEVK